MDSPLKKFIEWYLSLPVPHRQSIVEFVIFFNIGFDDIDTTKMEDLHNAFVKKHFSATGEEFMTDRASEFLRELPFKQEQWVSTNEKWQELVESYLSDNYIDHWRKDLS